MREVLVWIDDKCRKCGAKIEWKNNFSYECPHCQKGFCSECVQSENGIIVCPYCNEKLNMPKSTKKNKHKSTCQ